MDLKEINELIKAEVLLLVSRKGKIVNSFRENDTYDLRNFAVLSNYVLDMIDDFFLEVLVVNSPKEIIVKSKEHILYIMKYDDEHVLCILAEDILNTSLISLSLKKNDNINSK